MPKHSNHFQTNQVSAFIDGGVIYGTSAVWTNHLRSFKDGKLLVDDVTSIKDSFPPYNDVGLPYSNRAIPLGHQTKPVSRLFRELSYLGSLWNLRKNSLS